MSHHALLMRGYALQSSPCCAAGRIHAGRLAPPTTRIRSLSGQRALGDLVHIGDHRQADRRVERGEDERQIVNSLDLQ